MSSPFDETEFVDRDLQGSSSGRPGGPLVSTMSPPIAGRPPTREELEARASETQSRIVELRRAQEELERERTQIEEARRRRTEFETGRAEMLEHLNRGVGLLEQAEFKARRDAEQMAKTLADLREALARITGIKEETWSREGWNVELGRALTVIENARMEWNSARLKWNLLSGETALGPDGNPIAKPASDWLAQRSLGELCRVGLALTWPLALVGLAGVIGVLIALLR